MLVVLRGTTLILKKILLHLLTVQNITASLQACLEYKEHCRTRNTDDTEHCCLRKTSRRAVGGHGRAADGHGKAAEGHAENTTDEQEDFFPCFTNTDLNSLTM